MAEETLKVKQCPFEHKETKTVHDLSIRNFGTTATGNLFAVCCKCGAVGPTSIVSEEAAVEKWGTRDVIILEKKAYEKAKRRMEINSGKAKKSGKTKKA